MTDETRKQLEFTEGVLRREAAVKLRSADAIRAVLDEATAAGAPDFGPETPRRFVVIYPRHERGRMGVYFPRTDQSIGDDGGLICAGEPEACEWIDGPADGA